MLLNDLDLLVHAIERPDDLNSAPHESSDRRDDLDIILHPHEQAVVRDSLESVSQSDAFQAKYFGGSPNAQFAPRPMNRSSAFPTLDTFGTIGG